MSADTYRSMNFLTCGICVSTKGSHKRKIFIEQVVPNTACVESQEETCYAYLRVSDYLKAIKQYYFIFIHSFYKPAGSFKGKQKKKLSIEHVFKN